MKYEALPIMVHKLCLRLKFLSTDYDNDNTHDDAGAMTIVLWTFKFRRTKNNHSIANVYNYLIG